MLEISGDIFSNSFVNIQCVSQYLEPMFKSKYLKTGLPRKKLPHIMTLCTQKICCMHNDRMTKFFSYCINLSFSEKVVVASFVMGKWKYTCWNIYIIQNFWNDMRMCSGECRILKLLKYECDLVLISTTHHGGKNFEN